MDCGSRRIIAPGRHGGLLGIRQKLASTPTPGAFFTIRRSMPPIVSSMVDMIPASAGDPGAQAEWLLGYPDKSLASIVESLALAERLTHPFTLGVALTLSAVVYLSRGEPERALQPVEAAEVLAAEQRLSLVVEPGSTARRGLVGAGCSRRRQPPASRGHNGMDPARAHFRFALWFGGARRGLARRGDTEAALAALREGLEAAGGNGRAPVGCGTHRVTGTSLLAPQQARRGPSALEQALRIAQAQQAKSLELRAADDLARLGANRAGGPKRAICSRWSTAGSPRASTPPI